MIVFVTDLLEGIYCIERHYWSKISKPIFVAQVHFDASVVSECSNPLYFNFQQLCKRHDFVKSVQDVETNLSRMKFVGESWCKKRG